MKTLFQHRKLELQRMFSDDINFAGRLIAFGGITQTVITQNVLGWADGLIVNGAVASIMVIVPKEMDAGVIEALMPNAHEVVYHTTPPLTEDRLASMLQKNQTYNTTNVVVIPNLYDLINDCTPKVIRQTLRMLRAFGEAHQVLVVVGYLFTDLAGVVLARDPDALMEVTNSGYWAGCRTLDHEADITMAAAARDDIDEGQIEIVVAKNRTYDYIPAGRRRVLLKRDQ